MLAPINELYQKINGRDVYIVGGGPSLKNVDISLLKNEKIITINNAYKLFEHAEALYWCDPGWADRHYRLLGAHPCKLRFKAMVSHIVSNIRGVHNEITLNKTGDFGYDPNQINVRGNNGGVQCLHLIINMKPKRIFLLGYDMKLIDRQTHWHNEHTGNPVTTSIYNNLFIPSMESLALEIKKY